MADTNQPTSLIQNSLASGEIAPGLYGRQDLTKVHQGAAFMNNFFVDYKGGASTRPGTQYLGTPGSSGQARLVPFKFSAQIGQTYMLVFSDLRLRFIKNPGGNTYPNSSNAAFILNLGVPYEVVTPYLAADLPYLKFSQIADQMVITRRGYARRVLSRISDTNWTLNTITADVGLTPPTITAITGTAVIAPDPGNTRYMYAVTAVDADGNESLPSTPFISGALLNVAISQGTVSVFWGPIAGAVYYRVYKALPTPGGIVPSLAEQLGFAGFSYGTSFTDNNIVPDFTLSPPSMANPFANSAITGYTITGSSADWPVGGTTITVADGTGTGAVIYPILSTNVAGAVGSIVGLYIVNGGANYTAPTLTAVGAGGTVFTATATLGAATGNDPDLVGLFQQRRIYAASLNNPNSLWGSRPGLLDDFRTHNPIIDSDSFSFALASEQVDAITWVWSMPGGLVIATNSGVVQLTGGSVSAANPSAVTPLNATIVPQSSYGSADIPPIVIDYDILYVQSEGGVIRDLQYNFFVNTYTGTDVTILSSHLFAPRTVTSWAYQDVPYKVVWAAQDSGRLLSMTWLKAQEILGWAQHSLYGPVESVATVREGSEDALYLSVNFNGTRHIQRLCGRTYSQIDDAWCLDAALSTTSTYPAADIELSGSSGTVTVEASAAVFSAGSVGRVIRSLLGKGRVVAFTDTTHVQMEVIYIFPAVEIASGSWRMDPLVSTVTGLSHLDNEVVYALVDGVVQGPFTVVGGAITLAVPGSQVVVGKNYIADIQPLYVDVGGETTIQGRLKKTTAVTIRVANSAPGLQFGSSFATVREWVPETSTDPVESWPAVGTGMYTGDMRAYVAPIFDRVGSVCIRQPNPLPATVLAIIPELVQGDTK